LRQAADENCALLGYYTASGGNFLTTFGKKPISPVLTSEDGTARLTRNVGKKLPILVA